MNRDWKSWNREFHYLSTRDLAEKQVAELDAETIREYAVRYAMAVNERTRRSEARDSESRASLATFAGQSNREMRQRAERVKSAATACIARIAEGIVLNLSPELLRSRLPGGSISWGEATHAEMVTSRDSLVKSMAATAETIARLDVAMRGLEDNGASCLNDLAANGVTVIDSRDAVLA